MGKRRGVATGLRTRWIGFSASAPNRVFVDELQTIEQELKGIQVSPASAALSGRPVVGHPIYPYSPSHSVNAGIRAMIPVL